MLASKELKAPMVSNKFIWDKVTSIIVNAYLN